MRPSHQILSRCDSADKQNKTINYKLIIENHTTKKETCFSNNHVLTAPFFGVLAADGTAAIASAGTVAVTVFLD